MGAKMNRQTYVLGTAVKITTVLNTTATAVTVSIEDSAETAKVTDAAMINDATNIYTYVYQSTSTDNSGDYVVTIKATDENGYTCVVQEILTFIEQA